MGVTNAEVILSSRLRHLLINCQTFCTVDCCHANAFDITKDAIARWLEFELFDRVNELSEEIRRIESTTAQIDGNISLSVRGLESEWKANEFRVFWKKLQEEFAVAAHHRSATDTISVKSFSDRNE